MAIRSRPGETKADKQAPGYDAEAERIVAALMDPAEPMPAGDGVPPPAAMPGAAPLARQAPEPTLPAVPLPNSNRRSRAAWEERALRLIMALIMGALLWIYVLDLENPATQFSFAAVPLEVSGLDGRLSIANDPGSVTMLVRAPEDREPPLRRDSFQPRIDLSGLGAGVHLVDVKFTRPPNVISVDVDPPQVRVELVEQVTRNLPVQIRLQGQPTLQYIVRPEAQSATPQEVAVTGPRDAVQRVNELVAEVNINQRQGTVEGEVRPRAIDFSGREVVGLTYEPQFVRVRVEIEVLLNYKTLPVVVPIQGVPAEGYAVTSIDVRPTTLSLYGLPSVLDNLASLTSVPVDVGGLTQTVRLDVSVPLTDGITLYPPGTANNVQVRVEITQLTSRTQLSVRLRPVGLAPGLLAQPAPERIDVTLQGPLDALQDLGPDSVTAALDLGGLGVGSHVVTPTLAVPSGTEVILIAPGGVRVDITVPPTPTPTITVTPSPTVPAEATIAPTLTPVPAEPTTAAPIVPSTSPLAEPSGVPPGENTLEQEGDGQAPAGAEDLPAGDAAVME